MTESILPDNLQCLLAPRALGAVRLLRSVRGNPFQIAGKTASPSWLNGVYFYRPTVHQTDNDPIVGQTLQHAFEAWLSMFDSDVQTFNHSVTLRVVRHSVTFRGSLQEEYSSEKLGRISLNLQSRVRPQATTLQWTLADSTFGYLGAPDESSVVSLLIRFLEPRCEYQREEDHRTHIALLSPSNRELSGP